MRVQCRDNLRGDLWQPAPALQAANTFRIMHNAEHKMHVQWGMCSCQVQVCMRHGNKLRLCLVYTIQRAVTFQTEACRSTAPQLQRVLKEMTTKQQPRTRSPCAGSMRGSSAMHLAATRAAGGTVATLYEPSLTSRANIKSCSQQALVPHSYPLHHVPYVLFTGGTCQ
jgi:hypothetical protein